MIRKHPSTTRRGIILLVVMSLLALFAALGLTFVFYADAESAAAADFKKAEIAPPADLDAELMLAFFLNQLIYGVGDANPQAPAQSPNTTNSAMRGHDLARNMYGYNSQSPYPSTSPYNGVGRTGTPFSATLGTYTFNSPPPNMIYYPADPLIFDPERIAPRVGTNANLAAITASYAGWNVPYTYPDLNNLFLGAMNENGEILAPSWWRYWDTFGPMDPVLNKANLTGTASYLKYLTVRPHQSVHPYFPLPLDGGGDVNVLGSGPGLKMPGGGYYNNNAIWMDLGYPVMIGPDGRKYKPLFASFITSLAGKVDLNTAGNMLNAAGKNASDLGLGPWEINPGFMLQPNEYVNLFQGASGIPGRNGLGNGSVPGPGNAINPVAALGMIGYGSTAATQTAPNSPAWMTPAAGWQSALALSPVTTAGGQLAMYSLPGPGNPFSSGNLYYNPFPYFPPSSYPTYAGSLTLSPLINHPILFNPFNPQANGSQNRIFRPFETEALLRYLDTGSPALSSQLFKLFPGSLNDPLGQNRRLLTTLTNFDIGVAGASPFINGVTPAYQLGNGPYPTILPGGFPLPAAAMSLTMSSPPTGGEFNGSYSYNTNLLQRVNLNRPLTPYATNIGLAITDRQRLASDIYNVFLQVTMGLTPAQATNTPATQWLAQLAVNMVDYIDGDNNNTPFNWNGSNWVYGTELPQVVISEVYCQTQNGKLETYAELYNPLPNSSVSLTGYQLVISASATVSNQQGGPAAALTIVPLSGTISAQGYHVVGPKFYGAATNTPIASLPAGTTSCSFFLQRLACPAQAVQGATNTYLTVDMVGNVPVNAIKTNTNPPPGIINPITTLGRTQPYSAATASPQQPTIVSISATATAMLDPMTGAATITVLNPGSGYLPPPAAPPVVHILGNGKPKATATATVGLNGALTIVQTSPGAKYTTITVEIDPAPPQNTFKLAAVPGSGPNLPNTKTTSANLYPNWLVHLDRQLTSPMELMHVSAYPPWQLTQLFMGAPPPNAPFYGHMSMPAWFDTNARIYRALEFFSTPAGQFTTKQGTQYTSYFPSTQNQTLGPALDLYQQPLLLSGRVPGRININDIWDFRVFQALCDQQSGPGAFSQGQVKVAYDNLIKSRSPGRMPQSGDFPFKGMAAGSVGDTFLRSWPANLPSTTNPASADPTTRLFNGLKSGTGGTVTSAPYTQMALMNKIYNNLTCRSNAFAVWVTVGFFDVTDGPLSASSSPGSPISVVEARKHFNPQEWTLKLSPGPAYYPSSPTNSSIPAAGSTILGVPWLIQQGCCITVGNQPVVVTKVHSPDPTAAQPEIFITANFLNNPNLGDIIGMQGVLGQEVGIQEGRNVRHRMFALIDRSALTVPSRLTTTAEPQQPGQFVVGPTIKGQWVTLPPSAQPQLKNPNAPYPAEVLHRYKKIIRFPAPMPPGATMSNISIPPVSPGFYPNNTFSAGLSVTSAKVVGREIIVTVDAIGENGAPNVSGNAFLAVPFTVNVTTLQDVGGMPTLVTTPYNYTYYYEFEISVEVAVGQVQGVSSLSWAGTPPGAASLSVNYPWQIKIGMNLAVDPRQGNYEEITVLNVNQTQLNTITAVFKKPHHPNPNNPWIALPGQDNGAVPYNLQLPGTFLGNPGPQQRFDHRLNTLLVPHYSIIR